MTPEEIIQLIAYLAGAASLAYQNDRARADRIKNMTAGEILALAKTEAEKAKQNADDLAKLGN